MDRKEILLDGITKSMLGVEIGPWHSPLAPKRDGYRSLSLDVFDTPTLRRRAAADPGISEAEAALIEEVDLIGSAQELASLIRARGLAGRIDYILSSHNLEHFPDLVRFLQACEEVLSPNGVLSLAIPDRRGMFDYFRPHSTTAEVIAAYADERRQPAALQILQCDTLHCRKNLDGAMVLAWDRLTSPKDLNATADVRKAYDQFRERISTSNPPYEDTHCWVFTPASFELIVSDLQFLGLIEMKLDRIHPSNGCEFFARFVKPEKAEEIPSRDVYDRQRTILLQQIQAEYSESVDRELRNRLQSLQNSERELQNRLQSSEREIQAHRASVQQLQNEIQALRSSTSFKLTAPLRGIRKWMRARRSIFAHRLFRQPSNQGAQE